MVLIECGLVLAAVLVAFTFPTAGIALVEALEPGFTGLARRDVGLPSALD